MDGATEAGLRKLLMYFQWQTISSACQYIVGIHCVVPKSSQMKMTKTHPRS